MTPSPTATGYAHREVTKPPNWHGLVVWDVLLNAVTTGVFLVAAVGDLARPDVFAPVTRWAYPLALAVLLADLVCLVLDLGNPLRFHHMLRVFKPSSPMSLGVWCLTAYSLPLTALAAFAVFGWRNEWLHATLIVVALPFAFGSAAYKGVLFSTTAQPGWRDARWLGAFHVTSAVVIGCGLLWAAAGWLGASEAAELLRWATAGLILVGMYPAVRFAVEFRASWIVMGVVAVLSFVLPLILVATPQAAWVAAVALLVGGCVSRSTLIHRPLTKYHPSTTNTPTLTHRIGGWPNTAVPLTVMNVRNPCTAQPSHRGRRV